MGIGQKVFSMVGRALRGVHAGDERLAHRQLGVTGVARIALTSPAFQPGGVIPDTYTPEGANVSPSLTWSGVPASARELVVLVEDPDAPFPKPFVHWLAYRIPPSVGTVPEAIAKETHPGGTIPLVQGKNSRNQDGWDGPAPPPGHGVHHYHFQIFGLDRAIDHDGPMTRDDLIRAMRGHVVAFGDLVGTCERR